MEEFHFAEGGTGRGRNIGRIVGFREHIFTHDVSAVANFFSLQELNFVSATQRALDNPLNVRKPHTLLENCLAYYILMGVISKHFGGESVFKIYQWVSS